MVRTSVLRVHFEGLAVALHGFLVLALLGQPDALLDTTEGEPIGGMRQYMRRGGGARPLRHLTYVSLAHSLFCHARSFS